MGGAWTNPSLMRSIMQPGPQGANVSGNALVHYPNSQPPGLAQHIGNGNGSGTGNGVSRLDDQDAGYERPPLKGTPELFNPKGSARFVGSPSTGSLQPAGPQDDRELFDGKVQSRNDVAGITALIEKISSMGVHGPRGDSDGTPVASPPASAAAVAVAVEEGSAGAAESS